MDFHIFSTPVSIWLKYLDTWFFFHIIQYLVELPLESLFQTILGLTHILFLASSAGYAVDQVVAVVGHIMFHLVFSASNGCLDMAIHVRQGAGLLTSRMGVNFDHRGDIKILLLHLVTFCKG